MVVTHETLLRVRYADTDTMGIVYYGTYLEYFEVARTEMLRAAGLPYAELEARGYALPVREAQARYERGARYDDLLRITTSLEPNDGPRLRISYEIRLEADGALIATGETTLVFVSKETGRPVRPPQYYFDALERYSNQHRGS